MLTGRENLVMIGELHHLGRKAAQPRAASCSSSSRSPTPPTGPPKTYSGGMRRRLDLAATLVAAPGGAVPRRADHGPRPARAATSCGTCSTTLVAEGTTVLLTTQYLEEADRLADDIVVVDHGRVIARGDARDAQAPGRRRRSSFVTRRRPATASTRAAALRRRASTGAAPRVDAPRARCGARATAAPRASSRSPTRSHDAGIEVEDLGLRQPTLDDVFLTLTGARRSPTRPTPSRSRSRRDERRHDRPAAPARPSRRGAPRSSDVWVIARRGALHMRRQPEALADATIQPVMFVLLFAYVFGGAIDVPGGGDYRSS